MSDRTVDTRVVSMRFDNQQFEQNVQRSINTLHRLRDSLNLDQSARSLTNLENHMNQLDVSGVNRAAETASKAFSKMGQVGFSVVNRLTNDIISLGHTITRQLTAPIRDGMDTYEQRIKATQVTMNSLNKTGVKGEKYVSKYLNDLNKYSDETIYRFSDMTTSLSKFVSAGVKIDDATEAIKGLGNVAALSGANTAEFSRAIYNISQSLGMGKMITRDWMSIENANMATKEFKETLIDTAKQMGYIDKAGKLTKKGLASVNEKQKKQMAAMTINYKNFRDSLSGGWLKNDILMTSLKRYADETTSLGKKGKAAATEVKSFSQLLDTLGDSLATKWSNIYENIVGTFSEAKKFWTGVSNVLEQILVKPLENVDKITSKWKKLGGRNDLINGLKIQVQGLKALFAGIKAGWESVFPSGREAGLLLRITNGFERLSAAIAYFCVDAAIPAAHIVRGLASALKIVITIVKGVAQILAPVIRLAGTIVISIFKILGVLGDAIFGLSNFSSAAEGATNVFNTIANIVNTICNGLSNGVNFLTNAITGFIGTIGNFFDSSKQANQAANNLNNAADKSEGAADKFAGVKKVFAPFIKFFTALGGFFARMGKTIWGAIKQVFSALADGVQSMNRTLDDSSLTPIERLYTIFNMIFSGALLTTIIQGIRRFTHMFDSAGGFLDNLGDIADRFGKAIGQIGKAISKDIQSFANERNSRALRTFAVSVLILAAALAVVATIPTDKLLGASAAVAALVGMLAGIMTLMSRMTKVGKGFNNLVALFAPNQMQAIGRAMISISVAVLILSAALTVLGQLKISELVKGGVAVAGLMMLLVGVAKLLQGSRGFMGVAMGLLTMAMAVGNLTKSLVILASLDLASLLQGAITIAGLMTLMAGLSKWLGKGKAMGAMASMAFMNLAMAINMLVRPMQEFGQMNTSEIVKGLIAMAGAVTIMVVALKLVAKNAGMILVFGIALTVMAPGIIAFAGALKIMSTIQPGPLFAAVAAIGALFGMLTVVGAIMSKMPLMIATIPVLAASFLILAPAVMTLSAAFLVFSQCNWTGILGGVVAIAGIAAVMAVIGTVMANNKWLMLTMPIFAASMLILAPAIVTLAAAFAVFSQCNWSGVLQGIVAIAAVTAIMAVVGWLMSVAPLMMATMPILAVSMLLLAPAIVTISAAFAIFSECNWGGVAKGVVVLLAVMGFMTVVAGLMSFLPLMIATMPVLAISIALLAPAIVTLAAAFMIFSKVNWGGVAKGVVVLLAVMGFMTVVAAIMSIFPLMIATFPVLAISLDLLAPAVIAIAAAFTIFNQVKWGAVGKGLATLAGLAAIVGVLAAVISRFPRLIIGLAVITGLALVMSKLLSVLDAVNMTNIGEAYVILCKKIADGMEVLAKAGKKYASGIDDVYKAVQVTSRVVTTNFAPGYYHTGQNLMNEMILGIDSRIPGFTRAALTAQQSFFNVVKGIPAYKLGAGVGDSFVKGLAGPRGLDDPPEESKKTTKTMNTAKNSILNSSDGMNNAGEIAGLSGANGFINGFGPTLQKGVAAELAKAKLKIQSFDTEANNSIKTRIWVAEHPEAIGKQVYNKTTGKGKGTVNDRWIKEGGLYKHYINGNFVGAQKKNPHPSKKKKSDVNTNDWMKDIQTASATPASATPASGGSSDTSKKKKDSGSKKTKKKKEVKAAEWGNEAGYKPNSKTGLWSFKDFFKGFNRYSKASSGATKSLKKWNKAYENYWKSSKKISKGIDKDRIKRLKKQKVTYRKQQDTALTKAAMYSGYADSAKTSKERKKWNTLSAREINKANKAGSKLVKTTKALNKARKGGPSINPKKISKYITRTAKNITGSTNKIKKLRNEYKKYSKEADTALEKAARYSEKADNAKTRKERTKWTKLENQQIKKANTASTKSAQTQKKITREQNKQTKVGKLISSVWTQQYKSTSEYKNANKEVTQLNKKANHQKDIIKKGNANIKEANRLMKKYKKSTTAQGKAAYNAAKQWKKENEDAVKSATEKLDGYTDKVKKLNKTINDGPNKAFNKMYQNVSKNIKDALKFSTLFTKDSGENIWEHFTYGGTKKDFESGKQGWRYAGYGKTQNQHYADLKANRDYILSRKDLSDEFKTYVSRNWRDMGDQMQAFKYASAADQKQIDLNYQQKVKNDHDSAYTNYKEKIAEAKKWAANIQKLAQLGFNGKALDQLINNGFSEDNVALTETMVDLLQNGTKQQKKDVLELGTSIAGAEKDSIIASIMTSDTYAKASPERQKELREALGWTDENKKTMVEDAKTAGMNGAKAYAQGIIDYRVNAGDKSVLNDSWYSYIGSLIPDGKTLSKSVVGAINVINDGIDNWISGGETYAGKKSSNAVKTVCKVMNDVADKDAPEVGKMLIQGLINGTLDHEHRAKLNEAAAKVGHITPDTVKKILGINSPSKVFYDIGQYVLEGLTNGLSDNSSVEGAAQKSAQAILKGFGAINQIGTENIKPTVSPVIDQDSFNAVTAKLDSFITDTSASLANQIQYQLDTNKAIQNFNTRVEYDDTDMINEIRNMHSDMMKMEQAIANMKLTMDTGALVGQITPSIDRALGQRAQTVRGRR